MLGFVEAVDLIHEHNGARAILPRLFRIGHHLLDFLDAGQHRRKLYEAGLGDARNDLRQRGLAYARRPPEDDGAGVIALDLQPQRFARRQNVLLADKFL